MIIRTFQSIDKKNPKSDCFIKNTYKTETEMSINELADTLNAVCVNHYFTERKVKRLIKLRNNINNGSNKAFFIELNKIINRIIKEE